MSQTIHNFRITEDDLTSLEDCLSLIAREGVHWEHLNQRPDIKDAWKMVQKVLSDVRFDYGPPISSEVVK